MQLRVVGYVLPTPVSSFKLDLVDDPNCQLIELLCKLAAFYRLYLMYLTIEVDDVDRVYSDLKSKGIEIKVDLRDEPWGDRHFAIEDPNGIAIDIVKYSPPQE